MEVNIVYIRQHKNKLSTVEHMLLEIVNKIRETSENYGLQESMLHVVKITFHTLNSLVV